MVRSVLVARWVCWVLYSWTMVVERSMPWIVVMYGVRAWQH